MKPALLLIAAALSATAIMPSSRACGPFFPADMLSNSDERLLVAPEADFVFELKRLKLEKVPFKTTMTKLTDDWNTSVRLAFDVGQLDKTDAADVADLRLALADRKADATTKIAAERQLVELRNAVSKYAAEVSVWSLRNGRPDEPRPKRPTLDLDAAAPDVPREFVLYDKGAMAFHAGDRKVALAAWADLMALPQKDRKYRSVWAAYMAGRAHEDDPVEAASCFRECRKLAAAGFVDSLDMAGGSYGWQALAEYKQQHLIEAIHLYLNAFAATGEVDDVSLRFVARAVAKLDDEALRKVAADQPAQQVVTAYILSRPEYDADYKAFAGRWAVACDAVEAKNMLGADRLAWVCYKGNNVESAEKWLKLADPASPVALWVQAKLALRAGKLENAAELLAKAAKAFPADEEWPRADLSGNSEGDFSGEISDKPRNYVEGQLALVRLARGEFIESLDLLLKNGFWSDAAFVAERVLTADELKKYVDKNWPERAKAAASQPADKAERPLGWDRASSDILATVPDATDSIRALLARRLMRANRWNDAYAYFSADLQKKAKEYVTNLETGHDENVSKEKRAQALWEAAKLARFDGMEIFGTELEPDFAIWAGDYEEGMTIDARLKDEHKVTKVSEEEAKRLATDKPPAHRFHYRYIACDLAYAAAALMPDDNDETAQVLWQAGRWIAARDPKSADRFYKALCLRCGKTNLGMEAKLIHWFPRPDPKPPQPAPAQPVNPPPALVPAPPDNPAVMP